MKPDTLTLGAEAHEGFVAVEAETEEGRFAIPMSPDVAREWAVRLMVAAEEAEEMARG